MRMRRKKHLEERLDNVSEYLLETDREISNVLLAVKDKKYIDFAKEFGNSNPVELEIGCGKGGFVSQMAIKNQNINIDFTSTGSGTTRFAYLTLVSTIEEKGVIEF